jgi:hypothetical protein
LPFALAAFRGEMAHQIFIRIAQDVIAFGPVFREIEGWILKNGDEVGEAFHHLLAAAELCRFVEVWHVGQLIGVGQRTDDLLVDLIPDVGLALERDHVLEAGAFRDIDRGVGYIGVAIADIFNK